MNEPHGANADFKMKSIVTVRNKFHNTSTWLLVALTEKTMSNGEEDLTVFSGEISRTQLRRAKNKLCGMTDCKCRNFDSTDKINGASVELVCENKHGNLDPVF